MITRYVFYGLTVVIYGSVALMSYGFDDEFFNITLVEQYGLGAFLVTQTTDVHPPMSYIINAVLYEAFKDWGVVRLFSALMLCASFIYLSEHTKTKEDNRTAILTFVLLASNPALLLWGTSIRWYAYFIPILIWLLVIPHRHDWSMWLKLSLGLVVLGYTGYLSFVLAPALVLFYWLSSSQNLKAKLKQLSASLAVAGVTYSPQIITFLDVHFPNRESQTGSLFSNFAGLFVAQFSNQGVFPISVPALIGAVGTTLVLYTALRSQPIRKLSSDSKCVSYALFSILIVASGVASKFRNLVIATPLQAIWFASIKPSSPLKRIFYIGILSIFIGNLWGSVNVYRHQDTTKNSWNLPIKEALSVIQQEYEGCNKDAIVFTHDPTLSYHTEKLSLTSTGIYASGKLHELKEAYRCVFVVKTFAGSISATQYEQMLDEVKKLQFSEKSIFQLQEDPFYKYKVKLNSRYPPYAITILKFTNVTNVNSLLSWLPKES